MSRWRGAGCARSRRRDEALPGVTRGAATKRSRDLPPRGGSAQANSGVRRQNSHSGFLVLRMQLERLEPSLQRSPAAHLVVLVDASLVGLAVDQPLLRRLGRVDRSADVLEESLVDLDRAVDLVELRRDLELLRVE